MGTVAVAGSFPESTVKSVWPADPSGGAWPEVA
jgi:hypothetical protein